MLELWHATVCAFEKQLRHYFWIVAKLFFIGLLNTVYNYSNLKAFCSEICVLTQPPCAKIHHINVSDFTQGGTT